MLALTMAKMSLQFYFLWLFWFCLDLLCFCDSLAFVPLAKSRKRLKDVNQVLNELFQTSHFPPERSSCVLLSLKYAAQRPEAPGPSYSSPFTPSSSLHRDSTAEAFFAQISLLANSIFFLTLHVPVCVLLCPDVMCRT